MHLQQYESISCAGLVFLRRQGWMAPPNFKASKMLWMDVQATTFGAQQRLNGEE